ncbi:VCBS repeat-containing protein [Arthrobacter sp. A2-55]|nr:VCBS repeat-containing protein [Arthrobacter sp. A2-55]MCU6480613.1 VCBS repeat-containing protein [Arthrobacter sp. A2-55]
MAIGTGWTGLGLTMFDFDKDGNLDLLAKNAAGEPHRVCRETTIERVTLALGTPSWTFRQIPISQTRSRSGL